MEELFCIYIKNDIFAIEQKDVLKVSNFNQFGGIVKTVRLFGGKGKHNEVLKNIIKELYK